MIKTYLNNIAIFGDIHGRTHWRYILDKISRYDYIVFMGDYMDSYDISPVKQLVNLKDILWLKATYPEKVVLLLGNHDLPYIYDNKTFKCSGFDYIIYPEAHRVFQDNLHFFDMAKIINDKLFTHAGVSNTWLNNFNMKVLELPVDEQINEIWKSYPNAFKFYGNDPLGNNVTQSPVWIRKESLSKDMFLMDQVIGHTQLKFPREYLISNKDLTLFMVDSPDYLTTLINNRFGLLRIYSGH